MSAIDYLIIGHVTQDRTDSRYVLGGTVTYSSLTASYLGQRVAVLTSAAFEPGLVDVLSVQGVQVARQPAEETTRFVNIYEKSIRRQYVEAVAEPLTAELLLDEWRQAPVVHLAPLAGEMKPEIVEAFPDALLGVTPQGWLRAWGEDGLVRAIPWRAAEPVLARADAIILSEQDLASRAEIDEIAERARLLVVTRGERGTSIHRDGRWTHQAAFKATRQVDPTGAGDVFAAAFLVHLKQTGNPYQSADFANCVASFAVEKKHFNGIPAVEQVRERWRHGQRRKEIGPRS
jgi:sugar/nucleoside kinase (ribokinase family)